MEQEFPLTSPAVDELNVAVMLRLDREYWGIENGMHLRVDVSGQEETSRVRARTSAFNL